MGRERFDKFTDRARRVLSLAQEEATRFNHNYIGTEHLLLGLVREGDGVGAKVLASLGVELHQVRSAVEFQIARGDRPALGEIGLTPRAKKVIELAVDEAHRLGHHYIGTEHLLLGLVREGEGIAAKVLESLGIVLEKSRTQTLRVLSASPAGGDEPQGEDEPDPESIGNERFDKFTNRARRVLSLAQEEAMRLNHNYIGTEHLLLGLVREGEGVAAKVLSNLGVELHRVRSAVEFRIGRGDPTAPGEIGLTPRAKKAIELAVDEARRLGHHYIGTEHLLLGLLREGEGMAADVLESLGVTLETLHTQTIRVLSSSHSVFSAPQEKGEPAPNLPKELNDESLKELNDESLKELGFTDQALRVVMYAREEAGSFNHNYIGTEHLLLGLLREGEGLAIKTLNSLGVELKRVRSAMEFIIGRSDRPAPGEIGLTPRAQKVIVLAKNEAERLGHQHVGDEHLLLGLVREGEGIAAGVLESLGVSLEKVRREVIRALGGIPPETEPARQAVADALTTWLKTHGGSPPEMEQTGQKHLVERLTIHGAMRGLQSAWEYLVVQVGYMERGWLIRQIGGQEDARFGIDQTPLHSALKMLGLEGWELVAIDHPTGGTSTNSCYIFKRPSESRNWRGPSSEPPTSTITPSPE